MLPSSTVIRKYSIRNNSHTHTHTHTHTPVLSKEKLEPEFLLSVDGAVNFNIHDVKVKGHHMETFPRRLSFTGSVLEGFKRSHFAVMVVSSNR